MGRLLMLNDALTIPFGSIAIWRYSLRSGLQMVSEPQTVCSLVFVHVLVHAWFWCMLGMVHAGPFGYTLMRDGACCPGACCPGARADARWFTFWYMLVHVTPC